MRVSVMSDLHLEFAPLSLPGGDVLILAGDACEARSLRKDHRAPKPEGWLQGDPKMFRFQRFFEVECAKYDRVFYVMGNHEHYHGRYDSTQSELSALLPPHVTLLEKSSAAHGDVVFLGATLWTDMNKGDPLTVYSIRHSMNDFKYITNHYKMSGTYGKLRPERTVAEHRKTLEFFKSELLQHSQSKVVVITHHAPSGLSVSDQFRHDHIMNAAYKSDLEEFILDHPQIKTWVHGHMHNFSDYTIGPTRVLANPRGYSGHESRAAHFDAGFAFDI